MVPWTGKKQLASQDWCHKKSLKITKKNMYGENQQLSNIYFLLTAKPKYFTTVEKICTARWESVLYLNKWKSKRQGDEQWRWREHTNGEERCYVRSMSYFCESQDLYDIPKQSALWPWQVTGFYSWLNKRGKGNVYLYFNLSYNYNNCVKAQRRKVSSPIIKRKLPHTNLVRKL